MIGGYGMHVLRMFCLPHVLCDTFSLNYSNPSLHHGSLIEASLYQIKKKCI